MPEWTNVADPLSCARLRIHPKSFQELRSSTIPFLPMHEGVQPLSATGTCEPFLPVHGVPLRTRPSCRRSSVAILPSPFRPQVCFNERKAALGTSSPSSYDLRRNWRANSAQVPGAVAGRVVCLRARAGWEVTAWQKEMTETTSSTAWKLPWRSCWQRKGVDYSTFAPLMEWLPSKRAAACQQARRRGCCTGHSLRRPRHK